MENWIKILAGLAIFLIVLGLFSYYFLFSSYSNLMSVQNDITQQAQANLDNVFRISNSRVAVFPTSIYTSSESSAQFFVGVNNDGVESKTFILNVFPVNPMAREWFVYDKTPIPLAGGSHANREVIVSFPEDVPANSFNFVALACTDPITLLADCTLQTFNWGEPKEVVITIVN